MSTYRTSLLGPYGPEFRQTRESIQLCMLSEPCSPAVVVSRLASIEEHVDIYCWYEGPRGLPKAGAQFMTEQLFAPLYQSKQNAKLCLYSLRDWGFNRTVTKMSPSTVLGEAINRINTAALECFSSSSFFQYCAKTAVAQPSLYTFINKELPKKEWLFKLSSTQKPRGMTVEDLFDRQPSLFDCIKDLDLSFAYSSLQYVEAYYLIRESVKNALAKGQKKIEIAFVLPNDENKYYVDLSKDIEQMLKLDFEKALTGVEVNITFHFFLYGDSLNSRPYTVTGSVLAKVTPKTALSYFDYLLQLSSSRESSRISCPPRDVIHGLDRLALR